MSIRFSLATVSHRIRLLVTQVASPAARQHVQRASVFVSAALATLCVSIAPAGAQTTAPSPNPPESRLGVRGYGSFGVTFPVAKDSFDAVGLSTKPAEFGGGGEVLNIWRRLFVQAAVTHWSESGERAFVDSAGNQFSLGIPLSVEANTLDIGAGWRFPNALVGDWADRLAVYAGGGAGVVFYKESSPFAQDDEDVDERFASYHIFTGIDVAITNWIAVGGDFRYRWVPDALGEGGVSALLDDDSLNGGSIALRVIVGR